MASTSPTPRRSAPARALPSPAARCRRKFLRIFPGGFEDETYLDWERNYKAEAHAAWIESLGAGKLRSLLRARQYAEIASTAVRIESRTNLLFSFEKMAVRDAVKEAEGARLFAEGLHDFLHGRGSEERRFERWCETVGSLPRRQTRVLTWPVATVFGFLAAPDRHIFLKPNVTRAAAERYGYDFLYRSRPGWATYASLLDFAETIRRDQRDLEPRDLIDIQSFIWVQGSDEYS
ncbi:MAG: hypothetical protein ABI592_13870 [Acidobacteriota bacterium]